MLNGYMNENNLPHADVAIEISISVDELRKNTDTEKKFKRPYDFKQKVIDMAVREINEKSKYHVTATPYRRGHTVGGYEFLIESQVGYTVRTQGLQKSIKTDPDQLDGQMNLMDYQTSDNKFTIT
jgi:plasmid replication initiation protein